MAMPQCATVQRAITQVCGHFSSYSYLCAAAWTRLESSLVQVQMCLCASWLNEMKWSLNVMKYARARWTKLRGKLRSLLLLAASGRFLGEGYITSLAKPSAIQWQCNFCFVYEKRSAFCSYQTTQENTLHTTRSGVPYIVDRQSDILSPILLRTIDILPTTRIPFGRSIDRVCKKGPRLKNYFGQTRNSTHFKKSRNGRSSTFIAMHPCHDSAGLYVSSTGIVGYSLMDNKINNKIWWDGPMRTQLRKKSAVNQQ